MTEEVDNDILNIYIEQYYFKAQAGRWRKDMDFWDMGPGIIGETVKPNIGFHDSYLCADLVLYKV